MGVHIKRAYDTPSRADGERILVDRLWPRGVRKDDAHIDLWLKDLAPSAELRVWFAHDPAKWDEFKRRYYRELKARPEALAKLADEVRRRTVTLIFAAKDERFNNAVALAEWLERGPR